MKATDLRIGNIVQSLKANNIHQEKTIPLLIVEINRSYCMTVPLSSPKMKPKSVLMAYLEGIEFNGQFLLSAGFNKIPGERFIHKSIGLQNTNIDKRFDYWHVILFNIADGSPFPVIYDNFKIRYIHQLQNFFFTLTGEELPIKNSEL